MSGIFGVFRRDGAPVNLPVLNAMREGMAEWGPDSQDSWVSDNFAAGFLLMRNTPESFHEHQQIIEPSEPRYLISADARIDNRDELCTLFNISTVAASVTPDSELIKLAYQKWGERYPEHLVGAYAIAIWDCKNQTLHLTRDHMGFRPLYVFESSKVVVFASDVEAILRSGEVARNLDSEAVTAARAQYTPYLRERSLIKGIKKVLPACSLSINRYSSFTQEYWSPSRCKKVRFETDAEYADAMREQLIQAVQSSVRSAYPIGSHLSGGLDSSAVTVAASRCLRKSGRKLDGVFSWSPAPVIGDYPLADERAKIQEVCELQQIECNYSDLTVDDIIEVWLADMSTRPQDTMCSELPVRRAASGLGIRTMLSGWGGDEFATSNGRGFFCEQLLRFRFRVLLSEMKQRHEVRGTSYRSMIINHLLMPLLPTGLYSQRRNLVPSELLNDSELSDEAKKYWHKLAVKNRHRTSITQHQINALDLGWLTYRIEGWTARSVGQAMEYRYPLLDRRLIEFCMGLPPEQFVKNGWARYVFRAAVSDIIPESICWGLDNKQESAVRKATAKKTAEAIQIFTAMCQAGSAEFDGISCMWQDRLLSKARCKMQSRSQQ